MFRNAPPEPPPKGLLAFSPIPIISRGICRISRNHHEISISVTSLYRSTGRRAARPETPARGFGERRVRLRHGAGPPGDTGTP